MSQRSVFRDGEYFHMVEQPEPFKVLEEPRGKFLFPDPHALLDHRKSESGKRRAQPMPFSPFLFRYVERDDLHCVVRLRGVRRRGKDAAQPVAKRRNFLLSLAGQCPAGFGGGAVAESLRPYARCDELLSAAVKREMGAYGGHGERYRAGRGVYALIHGSVRVPLIGRYHGHHGLERRGHDVCRERRELRPLHGTGKRCGELDRRRPALDERVSHAVGEQDLPPDGMDRHFHRYLDVSGHDLRNLDGSGGNKFRHIARAGTVAMDPKSEQIYDRQEQNR